MNVGSGVKYKMKTISNHSLHLVLSLFFLPMIVIYAVTGIMYMAGTDGNFSSRIEIYLLKGEDAPPYAASCKELERRGVNLPEGKVRPFKGKHVLGSLTDTHVLFENKGKDIQAEVIDPGIYPKLLLAHKGKAGILFTILGYGAALSLLAMYVTGILLMWRNRTKRRLMLTSAAVGLGIVIVAYLTM